MDGDSGLHSLLPARRRPRVEGSPEYVAGSLATGGRDALVPEVLPRALRPGGGLSTEDDGLLAADAMLGISARTGRWF
jgi:hypothetical protein